MAEARVRARAAGVAFAVLALASSAAARHTDEEHITTDTAWTLAGEKDWQVGLFRASVTIVDRVSLGTYTWPWLAGVPSLQLKWRFLSADPLHFAAEVGVVRLDTSRFNRSSQPDAPVFTVTTGALASSIQFNPEHQLSNNLVVTGVRLEGQVTSDTLRGAGESVLTNLQYVGAYEYRMSRTLALVVTARYQLLNVIAGRVSSTVQPDAFTTIELAAEGNDDSVIDFQYAFSVVPSFNWSWDTFNLRLGLGYGNYNLPGVNFMLPARALIPELDLFWTF